MRFIDVLKSLRSGPLVASAAIEAALAEAEAAAIEAERSVEGLTAHRGALLLDGSDRELETIEKELQLAQRDSDRAGLAISELRTRLEQARETERLAALDATHRDAIAMQLEGIELVSEYERLALGLVPIMDRLKAITEGITEANATLRASNDPRRVVDPDQHARGWPQLLAPPPPIWLSVRLPALTNGYVFIWPGTDILPIASARSPMPRPDALTISRPAPVSSLASAGREAVSESRGLAPRSFISASLGFTPAPDEDRVAFGIFTSSEPSQDGFDVIEYTLQPGAVDLALVANHGCPLLSEHDFDIQTMLGVVEAAWLEPPDLLVGRVRFARSPRAEVVWTMLCAVFRSRSRLARLFRRCPTSARQSTAAAITASSAGGFVRCRFVWPARMSGPGYCRT